ncbi:MAG TPA: hypothetical protein VD887_03460 [Allosphingosinicella sp.]|nr:hypothetical protein [Allosphingosinicella sp.]
MPMYVYATEGEAVGFLFESFLFDFGGVPLGRLFGSRVHRLDGSYVGEWFHQMVVARRAGSARPLFAATPAQRPRVPPRPEPRRPVAEYGLYPDAFHLLYEPQMLQAAE